MAMMFLLVRFWDVDKGAIKVGGIDIRDIEYDDLLSTPRRISETLPLHCVQGQGDIEWLNDYEQKINEVKLCSLLFYHRFSGYFYC
ncbi:hypothetical protein M1N50_03815 [Dehalococcoidia bacterium]|nr:hypothetical protein [Dehalococcoidia bacterium]